MIKMKFCYKVIKRILILMMTIIIIIILIMIINRIKMTVFGSN